jgi:hypothetical protein
MSDSFNFAVDLHNSHRGPPNSRSVLFHLIKRLVQSVSAGPPLVSCHRVDRRCSERLQRWAFPGAGTGLHVLASREEEQQRIRQQNRAASCVDLLQSDYQVSALQEIRCSAQPQSNAHGPTRGGCVSLITVLASHTESARDARRVSNLTISAVFRSHND